MKIWTFFLEVVLSKLLSATHIVLGLHNTAESQATVCCIQNCIAKQMYKKLKQ